MVIFYLSSCAKIVEIIWTKNNRYNLLINERIFDIK